MLVASPLKGFPMQLDFQQITNREIYNLINGLVAPRPIALVTSLSPEGRLNAAPFSAYNYLCTHPPIIGIGIAARNAEGEMKDTSRNIEFTNEFVVNVVTEDIAQKMNICGIEFPSDVSELEMAGFTIAPSLIVKVPRIKEAHAALECRLYESLKPRGAARIILGEVVAAYVEDRFISNPDHKYINAQELHSIGRMNALNNYVRTQDAFISIPRLNYEQWQRGKRG
jgi:flavin reductase (DIM6/NTAB) family NADH-FMN oxidoreductase RutF